MKPRLLCTFLIACVGLSISAAGQMPQTNRQIPGNSGTDKSEAKQETLVKPGSLNPTPLTPKSQAVLEQVGVLDQAAATALADGQYTEAENDARQSILLGHDSGLAQELLASSLNAQGKKQEALQAYRVIASSGDDHPRNLLPYALLLLNSGRWVLAVTAYNKALIHLADGSLMRANSRFSVSIPEPTALAAAIHISLGLTDNWESDWAGNRQHVKAMEEYQKALQLAPNSDLANYYYGYGLQRLGRRVQASAAFEKTVKLAKGAVKAAAEEALKKQKPA